MNRAAFTESNVVDRWLAVHERLVQELIAARAGDSHWTGELSASALSTATAVSAIGVVLEMDGSQPEQVAELRQLMRRGYEYLATQQNSDGGYGDTDRSYSNIATSYLVLAANTIAERVLGLPSTASSESRKQRLQGYIRQAGELSGLRRRYGTDKTFVVPIMTNLAIAGLVSWREIPKLPFEAAVVPGRWYRLMRMPVVSYAIPALVAIGQAQHFLAPPVLWPWQQVRRSAVARTMRVLARMQPDSGGYLEATPLTAFVLMSLAASLKRRPQPLMPEMQQVMDRCLAFLQASIRPEGSWPIDTNLATWVTSLAIHSLAQTDAPESASMDQALIQWHLDCQHRKVHPFTGASPGGWGWTQLSGAVPDGDDTPAAIIAASCYRAGVTDRELLQRIDASMRAGLSWLADLQNADGGIPTFCRGWGRLPFDRSSTDLTAHFLRAIDAAEQGGGEVLDAGLRRRLQGCRQKAMRFLSRRQRADGSWLPLWFGNQDRDDDENTVYGTARVLLALREVAARPLADMAVDFLLGERNRDGGWGGGVSLSAKVSESVQSSVEETSVALEAICHYYETYLVDHGLNSRYQGSGLSESPSLPGRESRCLEAIIGAASWLTDAIEREQHRVAWPIGFYFAKLWYYEKLYPLVFATAAMGAVVRLCRRQSSLQH